MSLDDKIPATQELVDSPFIPGTRTQYAWDSVSLTAILSCPRRYYYQIIEGYKPRSAGFSIALVFGIAFHKAAERYHNFRAQGVDHDDAVESAVYDTLQLEGRSLPTDETLEAGPTAAEVTTDEEGEALDDDGISARNTKVRTRYHLARAVVWYLENYASDPLVTHILPSGRPAVELSFRAPLPLETDGHQLMLCGHIDRVVSFNDRLYVSDFKTTKSLTRQYFNMFDLSHQMTGYSVGGALTLQEPPAGIWIDGVALQVNGVKFARHLTSRTGGQIGEYFKLVEHAAEMSKKYDEEDNYPLNTAACYFCEMKDICRLTPELRQSYLDQHFERSVAWNPLQNR